MKERISIAGGLALAIMSLSSCFITVHRDSLLVPVGRRSAEEVSATVDAKPVAVRLEPDGSGGSWLGIPLRELRGKRKLTVRLRISAPAASGPDAKLDDTRWTSPSALIDSDDPAVKAEAASLAAGRAGREGAARAILRFAQGMEFRPSPGMHRKKASESLAEGGGICVNHSRVFIALCRAAGVPARSISGTLSGVGRDGHHEWAEYRGDDGRWRPVDPVADFDLDGGPAEPKHVDLVYDIESNPIHPFDRGWERTNVALKNGDLSLFCADWNRQMRDGGMGYKRDGPGEVSIEYDLEKCLGPR
jgi:transglutaminase-like putative cysteine protease